MKALVKALPEQGLWLQDVPEPTIGINDVLIKVHRTGICGTDLHIHAWDAWARAAVPVPLVIGHELIRRRRPRRRTVITHRFAAAEFAQAFATAASGNAGKVVLDWEQL